VRLHEGKHGQRQRWGKDVQVYETCSQTTAALSSLPSVLEGSHGSHRVLLPCMVPRCVGVAVDGGLLVSLPFSEVKHVPPSRGVLECVGV